MSSTNLELTGETGCSAAAAQALMKQAWAAGDFSAMAHSTVLVGELLCESARLKAGERVLDVATGSGNAALAAARRACEVKAIDFVEALLDRARERTAAERLKIDFLYGDAEAIPFGNSSFDVVLSTFGTMFAPNPELATREMFRVVRPGGRVAMTAWRPDGISGRMFELERMHTPSDRQIADPILWGLENTARRRLEPYAASVRFEKRSVWQRSRSFDHWMSVRLKYFGPLKTVVKNLSIEERGLLIEQFRNIISSVNCSGDRTVLIENQYVEIIAVKK